MEAFRQISVSSSYSSKIAVALASTLLAVAAAAQPEEKEAIPFSHDMME
jgi:hypothetical protein